MPQLIALSLSIAVLGGIWAFLALGPLAGFVLVWAGFVAWGCFFHSGGDLLGDANGLVDGDGTSCNPLGQGLTGHELEHEIMRVPGLLEPVDRGDVGVVQRRENFGLSLEARQSLRVSGKRFGQDFDGDVPAEFSVLGSEDLAHPAFANRLDDLVVAEHLAGLDRHERDDIKKRLRLDKESCRQGLGAITSIVGN